MLNLFNLCCFPMLSQISGTGNRSFCVLSEELDVTENAVVAKVAMANDSIRRKGVV